MIILASNSPRRKELLNRLGIEFEIIPPDIDEILESYDSPEEYVALLSNKKAINIADKIKADRNTFILAADTVVVLDGNILEKPKDKEDAFNMLLKLSDKYHSVMTGVTILNNDLGKLSTKVETTIVKMSKLSNEVILRYIETKEPFDKAGAYGIQGKGALLVEKIEGCYNNVVGLPLYLVSLMFKDMGINLL